MYCIALPNYSPFFSSALLSSPSSFSSSSGSSVYLYSSANSPLAIATTDGMMMHDGTR